MIDLGFQWEDKDVILDAVGVKQTTEVISAAQMYFNHIDKVLQKYFPNMSEEELSQLSEADIEKAMLIDSMTSGTVKTVEMVENYFNIFHTPPPKQKDVLSL